MSWREEAHKRLSDWSGLESVRQAAQAGIPIDRSVTEWWHNRAREADEQYLKEVFARHDAKRDAMYVDPYTEVVSLYLEYECGIPR